MDRVRVELGLRSYDIVIHNGALEQLPALLHEEAGDKTRVMLVTNPVIYKLYGQKVQKNLGMSKEELIIALVNDGEEYKTMAEAERLIDLLIEHKFDRHSLILALGGGVIGDLAGFVAAIYQRGIDYVQIPTTLVAQVDSSVGGKTAVNHPNAKNMIGAFHQPRLVVIDPLVLRSLSQRDFLSGLAEVVKYGLIADRDFFDFLRDNAEKINAREDQVIQQIILWSCRIKGYIVENDEREGGIRAILNLGHTFGHAIERYFGYGHYRHGEAVAIGMGMAAGLANQLEMLKTDDMEKILELLKSLRLDFPDPEIPAEHFMRLMSMDKKAKDGRLRLVLPTDIGKVQIVVM
ncbi:MAG: 3-dehydroquinate synthase [Syntrophomonadaceae bacterium]|mgnify:CR=1 FL=1|nr:3-dehydroquinate synthase [Syntrophomonadaceae bacterium]